MIPRSIIQCCFVPAGRTIGTVTVTARALELRKCFVTPIYWVSLAVDQTENQVFQTETIYERFNNHGCPNLREKPKC